MTLYRTVAPAIEPVAVAEARDLLRIGHEDDDALLASLITAAREEVERSTGLALVDQSWRLALDRWPGDGVVALRRHPVREILSVTVYGGDGEASLLDPADRDVDLASRPARLVLHRQPVALRRLNGIEIDFVAGFGEAGPDVPDSLRRAVLMLVAHWYEFRAHVSPADQPVSFPAGFERTVAGWRSGRLS